MKKFEKKGMDERGIAHIIAAFGYSMAGLKVLLGESAARLEIAFFAVAIVLFAITGASLGQYIILTALFIGLLCIEALNTAIELIIDKTSPEQSDYAKQAKDLGSFAVFCGLVLFGGYGAWVVFRGVLG